MAIKENPLSGEDKEKFQQRDKELKGKVRESIDEFAEEEVLTDKKLLRGLNLKGAPGKSKSKPAAKSTARAIAEVEDEEDEEPEEEDEDVEDQDDEDDVDSDDEEDDDTDDEEDDDSEDDDDESDEDEDDEDAEDDDDSEDDEDEDEEDADDEDEESDEDDEDLEPKSKKRVQKRIATLKEQNRALEAELAKARKSVEETEDEPKDPHWKRLEAIYEKYGEEGIEQLQDEIAVALRKADDKTAAELVKLNRRAQKFQIEAPARFQKKQVREFQKAIIQVHKDLGKDVFAKAAPEIFQLATSIFSRSKALQKSLDGQAEAVRLATEHWTEMRKRSRPEDKDEKLRLKRKLNRLKKKTSLDGARTAKGQREERKPDKKALRRKAATGNSEDKLAYLKEELDFESLIPDDLRG